MSFISSRLHGIWDYVVSVALIAAPFLFGFADGGPAMYTAIGVGVAIMGLSLITKFEYSLVKIVPLPVHLMADMGAGLFLAVSPWLFGFADFVYLSHVIIGVAEILVATMTVKTPYLARGEFGKRDIRHASV